MRDPYLKGIEAFVTNPQTNRHYHEYPSSIAESTSTSLGGKHIAKYIQAVEGDRFCLTLKFDKTYPRQKDGLLCNFLVNGKLLDNYCIQVEDRATLTFTGPRHKANGEYLQQGMVFTALNTIDELINKVHGVGLDNLGEISVEIIRCKLGRAKRIKAKDTTVKNLPDHSTLPEKALKGRMLSSAVNLTPCEVRSVGWKAYSTQFPWGKEPIAKFIWKYRSRRDLEVEGILDRPPSPVPLLEKNLEDMTPAELMKLASRQQALLQQHGSMVKTESAAKVKRENVKRGPSELADDDEVMVLGSKKARTTQFIDLSED